MDKALLRAGQTGGGRGSVCVAGVRAHVLIVRQGELIICKKAGGQGLRDRGNSDRGGLDLPLLAEDLEHGVFVGFVDLGQSLLDQGAVFKVAGAEHLGEAEGGVAEQDFGVLEPLVVIGHG